MEIAIIFGGVSYEHEISIVSAIALKKVLTCKVKFIFCDKNHEFYLIPNEKMKAKYFSDGSYKSESQIFFKKHGFFAKSMFGQKDIEFNVALNLIHGADGEDGVFSALFDFFDIPYIGSRIESSVLSFSKLWTKHLAKELGVKTLDYEIITKEKKDISLSYPFIIKPLRLGSSIGIKIVKSKEELDYALDEVFEFDNLAIVEPFVQNVKEYNQAGCLGKDGFIFSLIEEPQKDDFLDFDKKYKDFSRTKKIFEANLSEEMVKKIQEVFARIYNPLFKGSMIRCDFFIIEDEIYLNEINPNPGSMANYLYEDFNLALNEVAQNLPKKHEIKVNYDFIHSINSAKGKA